MRPPEGMSEAGWSRVQGLSSSPTERHPFGLRNAVQERAAILHYDAGLPWPEADATAWDLEVGGGQRALFGGGT